MASVVHHDDPWHGDESQGGTDRILAMDAHEIVQPSWEVQGRKEHGEDIRNIA